MLRYVLVLVVAGGTTRLVAKVRWGLRCWMQCQPTPQLSSVRFGLYSIEREKENGNSDDQQRSGALQMSDDKCVRASATDTVCPEILRPACSCTALSKSSWPLTVRHVT